MEGKEEKATAAHTCVKVNSSGNVCSLCWGGGGGIFVDIRSSGLVKLFLLRIIGLPEAEQGKVNGAFME